MPIYMGYTAAVSPSVREIMAERHTPPPLSLCHSPSQKPVSERGGNNRVGGAASLAPGDAGGGRDASPMMRRAKGRQVLAMEKRRAVAAQAARVQEEQQREAEVCVSGRTPSVVEGATDSGRGSRESDTSFQRYETAFFPTYLRRRAVGLHGEEMTICLYTGEQSFAAHMVIRSLDLM